MKCHDVYNQKTWDDVSFTLRCGAVNGDGTPVVYGSGGYCLRHQPAGGGMNPFDEELGETQSVCHQGGVMQVNERPETIGFKAGQSKDGGLGDEREVSPALSHKPSALEPTAAYGYDGYNQTANEELCVPLRAGEGDEEKAKVMHMADLSQMRYIVRRLTPTEAERLMGLPDGYLIPAGLRRFFNVDGEPPPELVSEFVDIFDKFNAIMAEYEHKKPPKGKSYNQVAAWLKKISDPATCPDSPMYKCAGNGWATNQPRWILTRLLAIGEGIDPFSTDFAPGGATASASTTGSESPDRDGAGAVNS